MGDFNAICSMEERIGAPMRMSEVLPLRNCMRLCNLEDIKSSGRYFTWNNKQLEDARVYSKIDRVIATQEWMDMFGEAEAIFMPEGNFDHTPILLRMFPGKQV